MQPGDVWSAAVAEVAGVVTVVEAVGRDLAMLETRLEGVSLTAEAATALALARELDSDSSATSKSMCARALNETMAALRASVPPDEVADEIDDLAERVAAK